MLSRSSVKRLPGCSREHVRGGEPTSLVGRPPVAGHLEEGRPRVTSSIHRSLRPCCVLLPNGCWGTPAMFGLLFESLVVRDLCIYSRPDGGGVFHYRDDTGLEVDAIIERDDSAWMAVEIELSPAPDVVEKAAESLLRLRNKIARSRVEDPAGLMVVTSTGRAYRRSGNFWVASITALGS